MFIDFSSLKQQVSLSEVVEMLGLKLTHFDNQWRGPCPKCNAGGERALVITEGKGYYCFAKKGGGDSIGLVSHVLGIPPKEAATRIAEYFGVGDTSTTDTPTVHPKEAPKPFKALENLEHEHDAVQALGINEYVAAFVGIGYCKKGIMRGRVVVPMRDKEGKLLGYCGYSPAANPILKFPPNFTEV